MTTPEVKRWREMAERFNTALAALRDPKASDAASEEYFAALGELTMTSPTAIPAMARMIEEREAEVEKAVSSAWEEAAREVQAAANAADFCGEYSATRRCEGLAENFRQKARAALERNTQ